MAKYYTGTVPFPSFMYFKYPVTLYKHIHHQCFANRAIFPSLHVFMRYIHKLVGLSQRRQRPDIDNKSKRVAVFTTLLNRCSS